MWGEGQLRPPYMPEPVTDVDLAFPAHAIEIMPPEAACEPNELNWSEFASDMVHLGIQADLMLMPAEDIDAEMAWRHIQVIAGTFGCKHEHKLAALEFLLGRWYAWGAWHRQSDPDGRHWRTAGTNVPPPAILDQIATVKAEQGDKEVVDESTV